MTEALWYLATVYTVHPQGHEQAFKDAALAAAHLMQHNIRVFCPIAHTHPISYEGGLGNQDHAFWMAVDRPLMERCQGLIVVKMENWENSKGIAEEIETFRAAGKPILYMEWPL